MQDAGAAALAAACSHSGTSGAAVSPVRWRRFATCVFLHSTELLTAFGLAGTDQGGPSMVSYSNYGPQRGLGGASLATNKANCHSLAHKRCLHMQ